MDDKISRQLRWQRKRIAEGLCPQCGRNSLSHGYRACFPCLEKRSSQRTKRWVRGGPGRPPWYEKVKSDEQENTRSDIAEIVAGNEDIGSHGEASIGDQGIQNTVGHPLAHLYPETPSDCITAQTTSGIREGDVSDSTIQGIH